MKLQDVQARLAAMTRAQWVELSEKSGVPFSTLKKIGYRQTPTPRSDTVDKIAPFLEGRRKLA